MRIGLYGGTFDPVHIGHLLLAETCCEEASLNEVWFIPNAKSPHKLDVATAGSDHRVRMLELAIGGHRAFRLCDIELQRGGLSYTVDTINQVAEAQPSDELFLLMGADALADFPNWKDPQQICRHATPLVVNRPDSPPLDFQPLAEWLSLEHLRKIKRQQIDMPLIEISSSDIRHRVAAGKSIRYRVTRAVEKYIETHQMYLEST